jgi:hypothetical protein
VKEKKRKEMKGRGGKEREGVLVSHDWRIEISTMQAFCAALCDGAFPQTVSGHVSVPGAFKVGEMLPRDVST